VKAAAQLLKKMVSESIRELQVCSEDELKAQRYEKFRKFGAWEELSNG
jgi:acetyl-CoA carboxylase alpha subunit